MKPNTEPTTIPVILPLLSQGPGSTSGCGVWVGDAVGDVADVSVDVVLVSMEVGEVVVVALVVVDGCSVLVGVPVVVAGGGGGSEEVSGLLDGTITVLDGSAVTKAIEVRKVMDVTKGGGFVSSWRATRVAVEAGDDTAFVARSEEPGREATRKPAAAIVVAIGRRIMDERGVVL